MFQHTFADSDTFHAHACPECQHTLVHSGGTSRLARFGNPDIRPDSNVIHLCRMCGARVLTQHAEDLSAARAAELTDYAVMLKGNAMQLAPVSYRHVFMAFADLPPAHAFDLYQRLD